jgi:hypothetical protein
LWHKSVESVRTGWTFERAGVGGASFVARRHRRYPRWLAWAGLVVALLMLPSMAAFAGFTVIGLILWTAAVGVWLARGRSVELTT